MISIADSFSPKEVAVRLRIGEAKGVFTQDVLLRGGKTHPLFEKVMAADILVIGSSIIVHSGLGPKVGEIPAIGLVGFLIAGVLGFWLLVSILRRGRM